MTNIFNPAANLLYDSTRCYTDELMMANGKTIADVLHIPLTEAGEKMCNAMHEIQVRRYTTEYLLEERPDDKIGYEIYVGNADFEGGLGGSCPLSAYRKECSMEQVQSIFDVVDLAMTKELGTQFNFPRGRYVYQSMKDKSIPEPVADSEATSDDIDNEYEG